MDCTGRVPRAVSRPVSSPHAVLSETRAAGFPRLSKLAPVFQKSRALVSCKPLRRGPASIMVFVNVQSEWK